MGDTGGRGPGYRYFGAAKQLPGVRELFEKEAPRQVRVQGRAGRPAGRSCARAGGPAGLRARRRTAAHAPPVRWPARGPRLQRSSGWASAPTHPPLPNLRSPSLAPAPRPRPQVRRTRAEMHRAIDADYYGFRDEEDGILVAVEAEAEGPMRAAALAEWREREAERQAALAAVRGGMADGGAAAGAAAVDGGGAAADAEAAAAPQFVAYVPLPDQKEIEARVLESKKAALLKQYISAEEAAKQAQAAELLNRR